MRFKVVLMTLTNNVVNLNDYVISNFTCNARALNMTHNSGQALLIVIVFF